MYLAPYSLCSHLHSTPLYSVPYLSVSLCVSHNYLKRLSFTHTHKHTNLISLMISLFSLFSSHSFFFVIAHFLFFLFLFVSVSFFHSLSYSIPSHSFSYSSVFSFAFLFCLQWDRPFSVSSTELLLLRCICSGRLYLYAFFKKSLPKGMKWETDPLNSWVTFRLQFSYCGHHSKVSRSE